MHRTEQHVLNRAGTVEVNQAVDSVTPIATCCNLKIRRDSDDDRRSHQPFLRRVDFIIAAICRLNQFTFLYGFSNNNEAPFFQIAAGRRRMPALEDLANQIFTDICGCVGTYAAPGMNEFEKIGHAFPLPKSSLKSAALPDRSFGGSG